MYIPCATYICLVCFKLVFTIYVYTPREYNLVSPTDASSNVKHTIIILSYVPICFLLMTDKCLMLALKFLFFIIVSSVTTT